MGLWTALIVAIVLHCSLVIRGDDVFDDIEWEAFKKAFGKEYESKDDEADAKDAFLKNQHEHMLHNLNDTNKYTQGIHEHSDKLPHEAIKLLCRTSAPDDNRNRTRRNFLTSKRLNEDSVDWVDRKKVTAVKNQGECGSCWAFTAAQAIESQNAIKNNRLVDLSEQQLVDCASSYGNSGCDGGWPDNAFEYLIEKGGDVSDKCYPYVEKQGTCSINKRCSRVKITDYVDVEPSGDETACANALAQKGPLAIAIHVDDKLMSYENGIYHSDQCDKDVNHGVLLVGYGTENGEDYWKIKNSWGTSWGEDGYFRLARNKNDMCNVCKYASYPVLA